MKIYFAGSIRGGRGDSESYFKIIDFLENYGDVLTEHIGCIDLMASGEKNKTDKEIHDRDLNWLLESDLIIAEVTNPSLGVGYEIGRAIEYDKNIFCLYKIGSENELSAMISGSPNIQVIQYKNLKSLNRKLKDILCRYHDRIEA